MRLARSAAAVAVAALVVVLPSAAHADTALKVDAVGDVQLYVDNGGDEEPAPVLVPERTIGDITKTRVTHTDTTVRVEMYYRALPKAGSLNLHVFRFVTDKGERDASIFAGPAVGTWVGKAGLSTADGEPVACKGLTHVLDYTHKRAVLTVPRTCLKNPQFVKFGFGFVASAGAKTWFDDGQIEAGDGDDLVLSPGVKH